MSRARELSPGWAWPPDAAVAGGLVLLLACGVTVALAGVVPGRPVVIAVGAAVGGAALVGLLVGDWVDGVALVALSIPLPALYASGNLRLAATAPVAAAVLFAWLLRAGISATPLRVERVPVAPIALVLGAFVAATLASDYRALSIREFLNFAFLVAFLFGAVHAFRERAAQTAVFVRLLVVLGAVVGVLSLLESVGIIPGRFPRAGTPFSRAALGFGQPNGLGLFLAIVLPFAVYRFLDAPSSGNRALGVLAVMAVVLGLFGTFSRGSWLAVMAGTVGFLLTGDRKTFTRLWLGILAAGIVIDLASGGMLRDTATRTIGDWVIEQRAALMLAGVVMFLENPLLGVGPGGFAPELERVGAQITWLFDFQPTPHNAYVQAAAETGIVGFLSFLLFLGSVGFVMIKDIRRLRMATPTDRRELLFRRIVLWSFLTVCFAGMVGWPFPHGNGELVMAVIALGLSRR